MNTPDVPRVIRQMTLILSTVVLVSAVGGAALSILLPYMMESQRTALGLFGFEVVTAVAAVLGILIGRGRFLEAPGLALACVGGTFLVSSALGWQAAGRQLGGVSLMPFLLARVLIAGALLGGAGLCILRREPCSWRPATAGVALGLPVVAAAAAFVHPAGRRTIDSVLGESELLMVLAGFGALVVLGGLLAASVHLIIGAFDRALGDDAG